jgi:hypothetical protein
MFISKVLNVASLKNRASLLSSQRMLDLVVYLSLWKDRARLKYNVWIMVMVPALSRMYLKNQVGSLSDVNFATCNGSYSTAWGAVMEELAMHVCFYRLEELFRIGRTFKYKLV